MLGGHRYDKPLISHLGHETDYGSQLLEEVTLLAENDIPNAEKPESLLFVGCSCNSH